MSKTYDRQAAIDRLLQIADREQAWLEEIGVPDASSVGAFLREVAEMLKEQEPRLMTLEEVKEFSWDYCYLEEERLPGKEYRAVCGDYALTCITWPYITSMRIQHGDESYGRKWRCWTNKPTDEQRKAVKWVD